MNRSINIPNKERFKLNEVCGLVGVKPYVLRFWESEFPEIAPICDEQGTKLYSQEDIEAVALIKKLLFEDKMTIEVAKGEMAMKMMNHQGNKGPLPLGDQIIEPKESEEVVEKNPSIDFEKIGIAKKKLEEIVFLTKTIEKTNYWN